MNGYTEDKLVQETTANFLCNELGWKCVYAFNKEDFGPGSLLGRTSDTEVVLERSLRDALERLNPGLPATAYVDALRELHPTNTTQSLLVANRQQYAHIREGVAVSFRNSNGEVVKQTLRVLDFDDPENNEFLCIRELKVKGDLYDCRPDIMGYVNGLPLVFMELKNVSHDIRVAYDKNFCHYRDAIPQLFHHNAIVIFGNGIEARVGSISSRFEHFQEWKRLDEEEAGVVNMETLLRGVCSRRNLLDIVENFIVFDESAGQPRKILARNHQFLGVNRAIEAVRRRRESQGRLGVFWHTQGSGKSYSMVFLTRKIRRRLGGAFTFLILTDRDDLDTQLYKTFMGCGEADNSRDRCRAQSGEDLAALLGQRKAYIFSLIQKFNQTVHPEQPYTTRDDIIVISDEAHRSQYGELALNMRNALPNASYLGFTGTPLLNGEEEGPTEKLFGGYISTYDFQRAVEDGATVPLYYEARGEKLGLAIGDLNTRIAEVLEKVEVSDINVQQRLEQELKRDYHIITAKERLEGIADDFVEHYSTRWESGKAMLVCIDKITCVRMYDLIMERWSRKIAELEAALPQAADEQEEQERLRQIAWMRETQMAVVVSAEQGEIEKFKAHGLDIEPHRRLLREGMALPSDMRNEPRYHNMQRMDVDDAFKADVHPFRVAIVCAMWLTGFDVPSLATLYLDKPLKAHTLMQTIARANRVHAGKSNGFIVDYCGILKNLRQALARYASTKDEGRLDGSGGVDPTIPDGQLLEELEKAIALVREFLQERHAPLENIMTTTGFARNKAIADAKEAANDNDRTRKHFEVLCRTVFVKFKACLTLEGVNRYREAHSVISLIYNSLQGDKEHADISDIMRQLQDVVNDAIVTQTTADAEKTLTVIDISTINFQRLKEEFARKSRKHTTVYSLKDAVEKRLQRLLVQNPLRTDFQEHYQKIVNEYNKEKDRAAIEKTFEDLIKFDAMLTVEESRAVREGLDEESLAVFDLLKKEKLSPAEIKHIKAVAVQLLDELKRNKLRMDHWTEKEATRADVRSAIYDYLYDETTGLPDAYTDDEIKDRTESVFRHIVRNYPVLPSPTYSMAS
ncbi:MAG: type I restriction endonuclease subunit R [Desulfovibrio sp.]|nr:type I restriction endonuclease subunit R [Desulfovibrio sp.]